MTNSVNSRADLASLGSRLRNALEALEEEDGPEARNYRVVLRRVLARGWRAAADCDSKELREIVELIREARPFVDDALPRLGPREMAAVELQQALGLLYVGEDELREIELETRLADQAKNPRERAVLQVLVDAEGALRQGQVHKQIPEENRPTPSRVGQILRELHGHGYVRRSLGRGPGKRQVAHYLLAPRGRALCREQGLVKMKELSTAPSVHDKVEVPVAASTTSTVELGRVIAAPGVLSTIGEYFSRATATNDPRKLQVLKNMVKNYPAEAHLVGAEA